MVMVLYAISSLQVYTSVYVMTGGGPGNATYVFNLLIVQEAFNMWMGGAMLTVMPVMALYPVASKHFIRGIAMTGIKGVKTYGSISEHDALRGLDRRRPIRSPGAPQTRTRS